MGVIWNIPHTILQSLTEIPWMVTKFWSRNHLTGRAASQTKRQDVQLLHSSLWWVGGGSTQHGSLATVIPPTGHFSSTLIWVNILKYESSGVNTCVTHAAYFKLFWMSCQIYLLLLFKTLDSSWRNRDRSTMYLTILCLPKEISVNMLFHFYAEVIAGGNALAFVCFVLSFSGLRFATDTTDSSHCRQWQHIRWILKLSLLCSYCITFFYPLYHWNILVCFSLAFCCWMQLLTHTWHQETEMKRSFAKKNILQKIQTQDL